MGASQPCINGRLKEVVDLRLPMMMESSHELSWGPVGVSVHMRAHHECVPMCMPMWDGGQWGPVRVWSDPESVCHRLCVLLSAHMPFCVVILACVHMHGHLDIDSTSRELRAL